MAIITVSRQIASLGDEISYAIAKKMNYRFIGRNEIDSRLVQLGFPKEKLHKYDDKKPGFFASLSKDRDEYLDYLQTAILEFASENNALIVGRGSFIILKDLPNHISFRFIADQKVRIERYIKQYACDERTALKKINESDTNQKGFHKSFFNFDSRDPSLYHLVLNTGLLDIASISDSISNLVKLSMTPEKEAAGEAKLENLIIGQRLVNMLIFDYELNINYLRVEIKNNNTIVLHGLADSSAIVNRALTIISCELPEYKVKSAISVVQDFKAYGR